MTSPLEKFFEENPNLSHASHAAHKSEDWHSGSLPKEELGRDTVSTMRDQIRLLQEQERLEKGERANPDLIAIDPNALTIADRDMFQKFMDHTLTRDEFEAARSREVNEPTYKHPRFSLYAYIANQEGLRWYRQERELEKAKQQNP